MPDRLLAAGAGFAVPEARRAPEAGPFADRLSTPISPPHRIDQPADDGEAEPGAAIAPGDRAVGLIEGGEQPALLFLGQADAESSTSKRRMTSSGSVACRKTESLTQPRSVNFTAFDIRLSST